MSDQRIDSWLALGAVAPTELAPARLTLHWASQPVSAVATTLAPPRDDFSHTNLEWLAGLGALAGGEVGDERRVRAALRCADLAVVLVRGSEVVVEMPLDGRTIADALAWLSEQVVVHSDAKLTSPLAWPEYELPAHLAGDGGALRRESTRFAEIGRWYHDADAVLRRVEGSNAGASPVRCWPHHFDIATLITLRGAGEDAKTIGVGMTPGDGPNYAEPYWYVTPWPYPPADAELPKLAAGHWHRQGWTGAILTAAELVGDGDGAAQAGRLTAFLDAAIAGCREIHGE